MNSEKFRKTLKVRVKDKHAPLLREMARSVNFVWNYVNGLSWHSVREHGRFLSAFDVHKYTVGAHKELGLHSHTLQCVAKEYVSRRKQFKKSRLNWRASSGGRKSLGWIPINSGAASWKAGQVYHNGHYFGVWDSYGLSGYKFRSSSFSEDSRGRWYFNVVVDVGVEKSTGKKAGGIDLGIKDIATPSHGEKLKSGRWYRDMEAQLGSAQRAKQKNRVRAIHAKITNRRKDALHKYSRQLVKENAAIFIGNVSPSALVKTNMAKAILDSGWGMLKTMLKYKCQWAGVVFEVVSEAYTTQTCSHCGSIEGPKGLSGLGVREWTCVGCGAVHDRDINAARNILAAGHRRLAVGIHGD